MIRVTGAPMETDRDKQTLDVDMLKGPDICTKWQTCRKPDKRLMRLYNILRMCRQRACLLKKSEDNTRDEQISSTQSVVIVHTTQILGTTDHMVGSAYFTVSVSWEFSQ